MKTYGITDRLDEEEVECRKHCKDYELDGIKVLGANLIDENQVYLQIKEEDGSIVSTMLDLKKLGMMVYSLLKESEQMKGIK